jgi:catechol 2,3-dioxygenase-like lactoylglutathione lyase family enzyme
MNLNHIAIACSSFENADKFYAGILGMQKEKEFTVNKELAKKIFNTDCEYNVIVYKNENFKFEVFIDKERSKDKNNIAHICIELNNREELIEKCNKANLRMLKIPKGSSYYLFIYDYDGNLFEVKEL